MPALAEVIPLSSRRPHPTGKPPFSADDQAMITSLITMLADEMTAWDKDGPARARIYFYFRFHYYSVERWIGLLFGQKTADSRQLASQLGDAFHYVTSTAMLDSSRVDRDGYRRKLNELAGHLRALLLIQAS
jgi:hypothetical protein